MVMGHQTQLVVKLTLCRDSNCGTVLQPHLHPELAGRQGKRGSWCRSPLCAVRRPSEWARAEAEPVQLFAASPISGVEKKLGLAWVKCTFVRLEGGNA